MPSAAWKVAITDRTLKAVKPAPAGKRLTIWDGIQPNFCVRVTDKGRISFFVVRRRTGYGQPTWTVLGHYPTMALAEAREKARHALGLLISGQDPRAAKAKAQAAQQLEAQAAEEGTFRAVAEHYVRQYVSALRSARSTENIIRDKLIAALGDRQVREIRRRDVIALIERVAERNGVEAARRAQQTISSIFSWAISRDIEGLEGNPASRCKVLPAPKPRDRVLRDAELRAVWNATEKLDSPWSEFYRVLMLSGQRRSEIAEARWSEVNLDAATLTIPAGRMKAGIQHVVPLTPEVLSILLKLPRFVHGGGFTFTTTAGRRPIADISHAKEQLDKNVGDSVAPWRNHDLRRTMRTGLSTLGVLPFIAELVIGHTQTGVHAVYDLHRYDNEKRDALLKWETRVLAIVAPRPEPRFGVGPLRADAVP